MDKSQYRPSLIDKRLDFFLSTFPAVAVEGPKWCGKTWTSTMHSKSAFMLADPANNFSNREIARLDVNKALEGDAPHLVDEWQEVPAIWDAVRYKSDERSEKGRFILTGSSTPQLKGVVRYDADALLVVNLLPLAAHGAELCHGTKIVLARVVTAGLYRIGNDVSFVHEVIINRCFPRAF